MSMKIKVYLSLFVFIINISLVNAQKVISLDSARILYIYQFITNYYLTSSDFWANHSNVYREYDIKDSKIILSGLPMDRSEVDSLLTLFLVDSIDNYIEVFDKLDLNKINTIFKVKIDSTIGKKPDSLKCSSNCRAYIRFTDIIEKDNRYFVGMIGYANMDDKVFLINEVLFEFEICKKNGFINFIKDYIRQGTDRWFYENKSYLDYGYILYLHPPYPCNPEEEKTKSKSIENNEIQDTMDYKLHKLPTKIKEIKIQR